MARALVVLCLLVGVAAADPVPAAGTIERIEIVGAHAVDKAAIEQQLTSKVGHLFDPAALRADIHAVWGLRAFTDVSVETAGTPSGGTVLTFAVAERPTIRKVLVAGNDEIKLDKINDVLDLEKDRIIDHAAVHKNREAIAQLYQEQGYVLSTVESEIVPAGPHEVDVRFTVDERTKVRVADIQFSGNRAVASGELRGVMMTKPPGALSFLNGSGVYRRDMLEHDIIMLTALYLDRGYATIKINTPATQLSRDGRFMHVAIAIDEGPQFTFGSADLKGDLPSAELRDEIARHVGKTFSRTQIDKDRHALEAYFQDRGYANVNVVPRMRLDLPTHRAMVSYEIVRGRRVYVERVHIRGNSKTRDKVIRRELRLSEGELFNGTNLERSKAAITRLGYFEKVTVSTAPGSSDEFVEVDVQVSERPTGQFQIGAGFSSLESFIVQGQVAHENFLGRGHSVALSAQISSLRRVFSFRFLEPHFLDTNWMFSTELYNQSRGFGTFSRNSTGGAMTWGHTLGEHTHASLTYRLEDVSITGGSGGIANLGARTTELPSVDTANLYRGGFNSSLRAAFGWDSRNNRLFPTAGTMAQIYGEYAGKLTLSENDFVRWGGYVRNYHRIANSPFVLRLNGEVGVTTSLDGKGVPLSERYLLGGIYDIRGYRARSIGPQLLVQRPGDIGQELEPLPIGGNLQLIGQAEVEFPLVRRLGLSGVAFFDIGNAYNLESRYCNGSTTTVDACVPSSGMLGGLRKSVGLGVRWQSPIGPLRFEWGLPLDLRPGEKPSGLDFTIGTSF